MALLGNTTLDDGPQPWYSQPGGRAQPDGGYSMASELSGLLQSTPEYRSVLDQYAPQYEGRNGMYGAIGSFQSTLDPALTGKRFDTKEEARAAARQLLSGYTPETFSQAVVSGSPQYLSQFKDSSYMDDFFGMHTEDVVRGILGVIGGGVASGLGAGSAGVGAASGGFSSAAMGNNIQDVLRSTATGALSGAAAGAFGDYINGAGSGAVDPYGPGSNWGQDTLTNMGYTPAEIAAIQSGAATVGDAGGINWGGSTGGSLTDGVDPNAFDAGYNTGDINYNGNDGLLKPMNPNIDDLKVNVPDTINPGTLDPSGKLSPELQAIADGGQMAGGTNPSGYNPIKPGEDLSGGGLGDRILDGAGRLIQNPRVVGALVGGLLGGSDGGGGGGGGGGGSSGPAPTITRGNWSPSATPTYMQTPTFGGQLPTTGNANSGLWRYASPQANQPQTSLLPAPQGASLLGQPQQSLLPPANQTQWQQPTGPTFNMSGQQLNQGSAMTQPKQPAQTQAQPEPAGTPWAGTGGAPAAANYTWGGDGERQLAYNKGQDMLPAGVKNAADANAQGWYQARDAADGQWVWTKAGQMKAYDTTGMQMQSNGFGTLIPKHSANTNGFTGAPMPAQGLLGTATTQDRYNPNNKV